MKSQPNVLVYGSGYFPCSIEDATHLTFNLPGPVGRLTLPVQIKGAREGTGNWSWNGNVEAPTLKPSILTEGTDDKGQKYRYHCFVNDGRAVFLDDCSHEFKGQTVELLDIDNQ